MADTAKRLAGPVALTTSSVTYYTVPASTTTIVRNIRVSNYLGSNATLTLAIGSTATPANCLYYQLTIGANTALDWSGFLVLAAAETITAVSGSGSALSLTISGVEVA